MFKYIKWELSAIGKKNLKWLLAILGLYLLVAVMPLSESSAMGSLIYLPFMIVIFVSFAGAFLFGTKKVVDTFRKKTFLLESMISFNPYEILFAKYIMAIIANIVCILIGTLGIVIIIGKVGNVEMIAEIFGELFTEVGFVNIMKFIITVIVTTTSFTSLVTLCYIIAKCLIPNGKGTVVVGGIIWWFVNYFVNDLLYNVMFRNISFNIFETQAFLIYNLLWMGLIAVYYLITVKLIQNKLEIYN